MQRYRTIEAQWRNLMESQMASVRYIVSDVATCVDFYRERLGFKVDIHPGPGFATLSRGNLRLYLNAPGAGSAGKAGGTPEPGGWNRFQIETDDLDGWISRLRNAGARFRGEIATGPGGRQILIEDPSGNVVELFEPAKS
jgi:catechol 2,3-dioxygenase-like lactoylglutathione lyase family enzyme